MEIEKILGKLGSVIGLMGAHEFFEKTSGYGDAHLELGSEGFSIVFTNGFYCGLHDFGGTIFGKFRDTYGQCSGMVPSWKQEEARAIFDEVVDALLV